MKKILLISALTLALTPALVVAEAGDRKLVYIDKYDANKDGVVSLDEFDQARRSRFDITDENNNGTVNEDEYVAEYEDRMDTKLKEERKGHVAQTIVRFNALDKNKDQRLDLEEYNASGKRSFTYYDTNKDSVIDSNDPPHKRRSYDNKDAKKLSKEELEKKAAERKTWRLRSARRMLKTKSTHSVEGMYEKYDTNKDSAITLEEHEEVRANIYNLADEDNNGWLSEDEYLAEYENRLDPRFKKERKSQVKRAHVRFGVLDKDSDGAMTFAEYQLSGHRIFDRLDTNKDGIVSADDEVPESHYGKSKHKDKKHKNKKKKSTSGY